MTVWIPMPGPPSLAARSEPFVLGTWTADDLAAYLAAHGAGCVVLDVANATSSSDVIDALKAEPEFPDWCASGWDSLLHVFDGHGAWSTTDLDALRAVSKLI